MSFTMFSPTWFFGYDVALELVFAIVTLIVGLFSLRIYRLSDQRPAQLFGFAFLLISISYFIQSILNFLIISKMHEGMSNLMRLQSVLFFDTIGIIIHITLMTTGLVLLTFIGFRTERIRLFVLLLTLSLGSIFMSTNMLYIFFLITSLLLIFICWHQAETYVRYKDTKTLLVLVAFLLILFGQIHFILSVDHHLFYVLGHISELIAYILILWNFVLVHKHGQKTRTPRNNP